jgi:starvation-inducible DNA-binding protein
MAATNPSRTDARRRTGSVGRFVAPLRLANNLQTVLVDLVELHLQGKQAHWNVVGKNFRDLHLQLDELVDVAREASDTIAERLRALQATADGRSNTVTASTSLPAFPAGEQNTATVVDLITDRIAAAITTLRTVHDDVDEDDPSSADLLHAIIDDLEKYAWMISAENHTA